MSGIKKREKSQNRYAKDLKRKIAKEYLSGAASYGILAEENGLRDKSVVKEFVKWYKRQLAKEQASIDAFQEKEGGYTMSKKVKEEEENDELRLLRKRLREEELKNELLETMIDIAEKELNIDIRKKSGTKQSKR